jgi:uncharacterized protein (TIGR02145 family)
MHGIGKLTYANGEIKDGYFQSNSYVKSLGQYVADELVAAALEKEKEERRIQEEKASAGSTAQTINTDQSAGTVSIGSQVWSSKNLDVNTFLNGDLIPEAKDYREWHGANWNKKPVWMYLDFNPENGKKFGKIYNWYAVNDSRGLAPSGWRIPSFRDWATLVKYNNGKEYLEGYGDNISDVAGGSAGCYMDWIDLTKLLSPPKYEFKFEKKESGGYYRESWVECSNCSYWTERQKQNNPCPYCKNKGGKTVTGDYVPKKTETVKRKINVGSIGGNESGFSALMCGYYDGKGEIYYENNRIVSYWWSKSIYTTFTHQKYPYVFVIDAEQKSKNIVIKPILYESEGGCYIRCIKD